MRLSRVARKKISFDKNPLFSGPSLVGRAKAGSPYRELPISEIDVDPDQPRRVFDTEALAELAASIKEYGVLCPILVRVTENGSYRLISGERRLRAAKLAGLTGIPTIISGDDDSSQQIIAKQLVENIQRQDLTSMERALAVGQLRDAHQWSVREIARKLGVSKSFVQRCLDVLSLPDDLQAALIAGAQESKVLVLAQLSQRELRKELLARLNDLTRDELELEVRRMLDGENGAGGSQVSHGGTPKRKSRKALRLSPEDERVVQDLQRSLGTRVHLLRQRGREAQGRLVLEFYSPEDFQEIFRRLVQNPI